MKLSKVKRITWVLIAVAVCSFLLAYLIDVRFFELSMTFGIIAIVASIASVVFLIIFNKCPHCKKSLFRIRIIPECCPFCGEKIDE